LYVQSIGTECSAMLQGTTLAILILQYFPLLGFIVTLVSLLVFWCCGGLNDNVSGNNPAMPTSNQTAILAQLKRYILANDDSDMQCSVCLESFKHGDEIRILPCKHEFHVVCIDKWLTNSRSTCPNCRQPVAKK